jgi:para-nitrobenzyl esterase
MIKATLRSAMLLAACCAPMAAAQAQNDAAPAAAAPAPRPQPRPEAGAPAEPDTGHADALAVASTPAGAPRLTVTSPAFANNGDIPRDNTAYGTNRFPGLAWGPAPKGTKSWLVAVQGQLPGGKGRSSIHLVVFNLAPGARSLAAGLTVPPAGARPGPTVHGLDQQWTGPHTHTKTRQPYHFQVLALDRRLPDRAGLTWPEIADAIKGHVLAGGDIIGWSAQPDDAS